MFGVMTVEQTTAIIDSVGEAISEAQHEPTNYWWLLTIAIVPVFIGGWFTLRRRKHEKRNHRKS